MPERLQMTIDSVNVRNDSRGRRVIIQGTVVPQGIGLPAAGEVANMAWSDYPFTPTFGNEASQIRDPYIRQQLWGAVREVLSSPEVTSDLLRQLQMYCSTLRHQVENRDTHDTVAEPAPLRPRYNPMADGPHTVPTEMRVPQGTRLRPIAPLAPEAPTDRDAMTDAERLVFQRAVDGQRRQMEEDMRVAAAAGPTDIHGTLAARIWPELAAASAEPTVPPARSSMLDALRGVEYTSTPSDGPNPFEELTEGLERVPAADLAEMADDAAVPPRVHVSGDLPVAEVEDEFTDQLRRMMNIPPGTFSSVGAQTGRYSSSRPPVSNVGRSAPSREEVNERRVAEESLPPASWPAPERVLGRPASPDSRAPRNIRIRDRS